MPEFYWTLSAYNNADKERELVFASNSLIEVKDEQQRLESDPNHRLFKITRTVCSPNFWVKDL